MSVPGAANMIRYKPPEVVENVRPGQFRNAMVSEFYAVKILHTLAVHVKVELVSKARKPFDHYAFGPVALIEKRGDDRDPGLAVHAAIRIEVTRVPHVGKMRNRKLSHEPPDGLRGGGGLDGSQLGSEAGQAEQDPDEKPKEYVAHVILVCVETAPRPEK